MATQAAITRWDKVLQEVQKHRESWVGAEGMTPEIRRDYARDLPMIINMIFMPFIHAWQTDRPAEGTDLHEALEPVAQAANAPLDFSQAAVPQVEPKMALVADVRAKLGELAGGSSVDEVISDIEHLLKVTVLVARVSHQGAIKIADTELRERFDALNKNRTRRAKFLDLHTMRTVETPSKRTISLAVFLAMVDPGVATLQEWMRPMSHEENLPPIMKQFAAQWVVNVYTEWDERFRDELATAHGCRKEDIRSDYFADLGKMRHDYVHNRGICRNSARNKVLKWFHKGDEMIPKHADYLELMEAFPADELRKVKASPVAAQRQAVKANADPGLIRQFLAAADSLRISKDNALDQALAEWVHRHHPEG